jgi:hypothetical protein
VSRTPNSNSNFNEVEVEAKVEEKKNPTGSASIHATMHPCIHASMQYHSSQYPNTPIPQHPIIPNDCERSEPISILFFVLFYFEYRIKRTWGEPFFPPWSISKAIISELTELPSEPMLTHSRSFPLCTQTF